MSRVSWSESRRKQYEQNLKLLNIDEEVMLTGSAAGGLREKLTVAFWQNQEQVKRFSNCISESLT